MTSFLIKKKQQKSFQDKIAKKAEGTRNGYVSAQNSFESFCKFYYDERTSNEIFDELKVVSKKEQLDAIIDILQNWIDWMYDERDMMTSGITNYISKMKKVFYHHGFRLYKEDLATLEYKPIDEEELYALQLSDVQIIFKYASPKKLSFYYAMETTGARPGEILQVRKEDIDITGPRVKIKINFENTKTRSSRTVFVHAEAGRYIIQKYKQIKDGQLVWGTNKKARHSVKNEEKIFNRIVELASKGENLPYLIERYKTNNYRKITLYSFREYFFGIAADIHREGYAHKMIGHKSKRAVGQAGYLPVYDRMSEKKKLDWFLKVEPHLLVDGTKRKQAELEKSQAENFKMQEQIQENSKLKEKLDRVTDIVDDLKKHMYQERTGKLKKK